MTRIKLDYVHEYRDRHGKLSAISAGQDLSKSPFLAPPALLNLWPHTSSHLPAKLHAPKLG
jgi:hypothetical protein